MALRRGLSDYQQVGFGGLSFATDLNFMNLPMSYEQRLWALNGLYCCALAKIEDDPKYKEDSDIGLLIAGIRLLLNQAGEDYHGWYETPDMGDDNRNKYRTLLSQIFEKITQLQGKTKMIDQNFSGEAPAP